MAKKKNKPPIINNLQNLNLEIDYDKLAEAIVKTQLQSKKIKNRPNRFRAAVMALANTIAPGLIALFAVFACAGMWMEFANEPVYELYTYIGNTILFAVIAVIAVCCAFEAWKDDDENAIMHFNTNVALVALIVAFVALVRGVG